MIDGNDVLSKADTIADELACIYHNELLLRIDNSNKMPYFAGRKHC
jgi:hypothetical protein